MTDIILPVFLYTLTMTGTPGPNNMMLTASGARFGYRRTIPLILGIVLGVLVLLGLSALGLGALFTRFPVLKDVLKVLGSVYLIYLSWMIGFSGKSSSAGRTSEKPLSVLHGFGFQFLNPKAYLMTLTVMSVYPLKGEYFAGSVLVIIAIFALIAPLAVSLWAGFGTLLGRFMDLSLRGRIIRISLSLLTLVSVIFIWI
jgi:threonine/homoserine/homoserine lactone efflux protein